MKNDPLKKAAEQYGWKITNELDSVIGCSRHDFYQTNTKNVYATQYNMHSDLRAQEMIAFLYWDGKLKNSAKISIEVLDDENFVEMVISELEKRSKSSDLSKVLNQRLSDKEFVEAVIKSLNNESSDS